MNEARRFSERQTFPCWTWLRRGFGVVGFVAICVFSYMAWFALKAEENLMALTNTTLLVEDFVDRTKGDWPRSWDQLAREHTSSQTVDWQQLSRLIDIDFQADPKELARSSPADFGAIRQKDRLHHFANTERLRCGQLILTLRKYQKPPSD
jgi:hypothetical protein